MARNTIYSIILPSHKVFSWTIINGSRVAVVPSGPGCVRAIDKKDRADNLALCDLLDEILNEHRRGIYINMEKDSPEVARRELDVFDGGGRPVPELWAYIAFTRKEYENDQWLAARQQEVDEARKLLGK
ncbi:hypothetical protein KBB27_02520 [Patescibacteria group bacterium]|nr:hypothetical protein [Patescibacteria group bacterium]